MNILYLIRPNLGCPALVKYDNTGLIFEADFASNDDNLNIKNILTGKLFLQRLTDTQVVRQIEAPDAPTNADKNSALKALAQALRPSEDISLWPKKIKDDLILVEVFEVTYPPENCPIDFSLAYNSIGSAIIGYQSYEGPGRQKYQYHTKLKIKSENLSFDEIPQIFNLVQMEDNGTFCSTNFHSVFCHNKNWNDFSFIHITDTHIATRNDFIQATIRASMPNGAPNFLNFNQKFRDFIVQANQLYREGLIDFIILTGDIVDFRLEDTANNFQTFHNIVTNESNELEVPIFTCCGNHDYRPNSYPIFGDVDVPWWINVFDYAILGDANPETIHFDKSKTFNINQSEAIAYQNNKTQFNADDALNWIYHLTTLDLLYKGLINPDPDQIIKLGNHRILCIDSGYDVGDPESLIGLLFDEIFPSQEYKNAKSELPNSSGFTSSQINDFIKPNIDDRTGLRILACHSPVVNSEHYNLFIEEKVMRGYYSYGTANNFELFASILYKEGKKNIDILLCGHTHHACEIEFNPIRSIEISHYVNNPAHEEDISAPEVTPVYIELYTFNTADFLSSLSNAVSKEQWWLDQLPLQIQGPKLFEPDVNKFQFLRVVIQNDIITGIYKHRIADPRTSPPFIKDVIILECGSRGDQGEIKSSGFGKLENNCTFIRKIYGASWTPSINGDKRIFSQDKVPFCPSNEGALFLRFSTNFSQALQNLHVNFKNKQGQIVLNNIRMYTCYDNSQINLGTYYFCHFKLPETIMDKVLFIEIMAADSNGNMLDSDPSTITGVIDINSFSNYEPGIDEKNYHFEIGAPLFDEERQINSYENASPKSLKFNESIDLNGNLTYNHEEHFYKITLHGNRVPSRDNMGSYFSLWNRLVFTAEIVDKWLSPKPPLILKVFNQNNVNPLCIVNNFVDISNIIPIGKSFIDIFPDKIVYISLCNSAYHCVGRIQYLLHGSFKIAVKQERNLFPLEKWWEQRVGIPNIISGFDVNEHFSDFTSKVVNKLRIIALSGSSEDKKVVANILDDFGTIASIIGLKQYAGDLYKNSIKTFQSLGDKDRANQVNINLQKLEER